MGVWMNKICFYGERGIVNGLVLDLKDDLHKLKDVLRSIEWCTEGDYSWIDDIIKVVYLIEPGFSKFGQPDLVLVCKIKDGSKRWLFIEVKVISYSASAMSNKKGMTQRQYNSSINGQLSLNYRLALALERYSEGSFLEEPIGIFDQYKKKIYDYNKGPRKAGKPQLIKRIVVPYMNNFDVERAYFVSITKDLPPNPINTTDVDFLPLLIDQNGRNLWDELSKQIGFLSLEVIDKEVVNKDGYFREGCLMHIGQWKEDPKPTQFIDVPVLHAKNWNKFPTEWVQLVDDLAKCIKENISQFAKCKRYNGSYSFIINNKTLGKLVLKDPHNPCLMVGFSIIVPEAKLYAEYIGYSEKLLMAPRKEPFFMVRVKKQNEFDDICEVMVEFLSSFESNK